MIPKTCKYYPFLLVSLMFYSHVFSQPSSLHFRHLTTSDGLSGNVINSICQDKEGFLWFGTLSGLNRFDGEHFMVFRHSYSDSSSIANNICLAVCMDSADNIWVRSSYSVSCFNRQSGRFINYLYHDSSGKVINDQEILTGITIQRNGRVLVSSSKYGLLEIDDAQHRLVSAHFNAMPSSVDNSNRIVCRAGVISFHTDSAIYVSSDNGDHFQKVLDKKVLPAGVPISVLGFVDVKGTTYTFADVRANVPSSLVQSDLATGKVAIIHLSNNFFMTLSRYDENIYWLGFWGGGLVEYDRHSGRLVHYLHYRNDASTVSNDLIKTLFTDKDKNLWIGTDDGIDFCNPQKDRVFMIDKTVEGYDSLDISEIETMAEDDSGKIWIGLLDYNSGGTNGLISFNPTTFQYKKFLPHGGISNGIWRILPEDDHLLLSTQRGLYQFNLRAKRLTKEFRYHLPTDVVNFDKGLTILAKDHSGNYFFGPWRRGLIKFDPFTGQEVHFSIHAPDVRQQLTDDLTYDLSLDPSDNIWMINGTNNVLEFVNNQTNAVTHIPVVINGQPVTDKFHCIVSDKFGHVWIGTDGGGLVMYDISKRHFVLYATDAGLPDASVRGLRIDDKDRMWVLTATSLIWVDVQDLRVHSIDTNILRFSEINGDNPLMLTRDGHIYIGAEYGFFFFTPGNVLLSEKVPQPIPVSFQRMSRHEYVSPFQKKIKIFPGDDNVSLNFVSVDMTHGSKINYAYYLKGYDDQWQETGIEGTAKFTKLPPGDYELQMRATFRGMRWNGKYSTIMLTVIPAFYQTWWFKIIIFLLVGFLAGWFIYYASTKRLRKKLELLKQQQQINNLRNRIASDIHDEIGAGLTRISIRSELVKQNQEATKNDYLEVLQNINLQSHELVNSLGEIVWTISPQHDKLDSMLAYFRHFIHQFMEGLPLQYSIHFPEAVNEEIITPDIKRNLFLILKEAMNNAVKHAQASVLEITFEVNEQNYHLKVSDNGRGLSEDAMNKFGNGIKGMKNRAALIRADLKVQSQKGKGTMVSAVGIFYPA